jgi:hypothetical protein
VPFRFPKRAIAVVAQNVLGTKGFADSEWLAKSPGYVAQVGGHA